MTSQWEVAVDVSLEALRSGERVLSHCRAGRHRSACFAIVLLCIWLNIPFDLAIDAYQQYINHRANNRDLGIIRSIVARRGLATWAEEYKKASCSASVGSSGSSGVPKALPVQPTKADVYPTEIAASGADGGAAQADTELEEAEAFTSSTAAPRPACTHTACTCTAPDTATGALVSNPHRCHTNRDEAERHHEGSQKQGQA